jgi:hypothetical protein
MSLRPPRPAHNNSGNDDYFAEGLELAAYWIGT